MYHNFYGLRESPFALTPDPKYLFLSEAHKEALASMTYGVQERKGFVLILGEAGTGKTTLIRHILGQLGTNIRSVFIFNSVGSFNNLLEMMFRDLDLSTDRRRRGSMVDTLNEYLLLETAAGRYVVLIIDEAQHLSSVVLEEIRMLSNLETASSKLLQIILVGQPELAEKLGSLNLRQLRQRISLVTELTPLTFDETVRYIAHRLEVAGHKGDGMFTRGALAEIYRVSGGIPRLINVICDQSLVMGYGAGAHRITRRIVKTVVKDRSAFCRSASSPAPFPLRHILRKPLAGAATAMLVLLIGVGLLFGSRPAGDFFKPSGGSVGETTDADTVVEELAVHSPKSGPPERILPERRVTIPESGAGQIVLAHSSQSSDRIVASVPDASVLSPASSEEHKVTVERGDTLAALIIRVYGRADYTLLDFVKMANPAVNTIDVIKDGQRIVFPPFQPSAMVRKSDNSSYVVHLFTMRHSKNPEFEKLQARLEASSRKVYVRPVYLADSREFYRVLVGDFTNVEQAETFYRSFEAPSEIPTQLWRSSHE